MSSIVQDIRYAVRGFARAPGFVGVAIVTLALGIGATTAIFSVVNGIVLRPLPFPNPDRLVRLYSGEGGEARDNHSGANFLDIRSESESFEDLAGFIPGRFNLTGPEAPQMVRGAVVTPDFFSVLGVDALLGRTLSQEADAPGGERTVVLRYSLWQSLYAGDVTVVGRPVVVDGQQYTVVGVMPQGFGFPPNAEFWAASQYRVPDPPFDFGTDPGEVRGASYFDAVGRLKRDIDMSRAQAEMTVIAGRLAEAYPEENADEGLLLVPLHESLVGDVSATLYILLGAVGFLLLIACANVASLLLVRAWGRGRELALRSALGASRVRIVRQLLTESVVLAFLGGIVGLLVAVWGTNALLALAPEGIPRVSEVDADLRLLAFALSIVLGTGVLFGLAPALQAFGGTPAEPGIIGGTRLTAGRARSRLRHGLIVGEVAVSLVLLVGAGLTVRTYLALNRVDPGFDPHQTLSAGVEIPETRYPTDIEQSEFYREVLERVSAIPGVRSAGGVLSLPINAGISGNLTFSIEGRQAAPGEERQGGYQLASPDYFRTLGIPLIRGRIFVQGDGPDASGVAVINQALADLYWRGQEPIGQRVTWGDPTDENVDWTTIVGIVGNTRQDGLEEVPRPEIFRPYAQAPMPFITLVVRSEVEATGLTTAIRNAVLEVDPAQPIYEVKTMERVLSDSLGSRRFSMYVLGVFAVTALVLAAVGLFGVLSFSVSQRSKEIAIRMALGAQVSGVIARVVREGLGLAAIGLLIGTLGAVALTRYMASMVYGVGTADPKTFVAGIALFALVALVASWIPALRAARADPMNVLKAE
jgi:putative ABC transport system permease protein